MATRFARRAVFVFRARAAPAPGTSSEIKGTTPDYLQTQFTILQAACPRGPANAAAPDASRDRHGNMNEQQALPSVSWPAKASTTGTAAGCVSFTARLCTVARGATRGVTVLRAAGACRKELSHSKKPCRKTRKRGTACTKAVAHKGNSGRHSAAPVTRSHMVPQTDYRLLVSL